MELVFCTNNSHKLNEVAQIIGEKISYKTLSDIHFFDEIPEPYDTLEENSFTKANQVFQFSGKNCFAEDTGLFVEALQGEPGVYSARYAGEPSDTEKNIQKVLSNLQGATNRNAFFKTIITLILDGKSHQFEGVCNGSIALRKMGEHGFGYDPVFIPEGSLKSFAQLSAEEKNAISHRRRAFEKMAAFLSQVSSH